MAQLFFGEVEGNQKEWEEIPAGEYRNIGHLCEIADAATEPTEKSGKPIEHNETFTITSKGWVLKDAFHSYRIEEV